MTLDEAIEERLKVIKVQEKLYEESYSDESKEIIKSATDNDRQLVEWLMELKELRNSVGAVKLSNMKEALALIRTLKAELNGWQEDPFSIIAEVCGAVKDCRRCQWYEKCPLLKNCGGWKLQQGGGPDEHS